MKDGTLNNIYAIGTICGIIFAIVAGGARFGGVESQLVDVKAKLTKLDNDIFLNSETLSSLKTNFSVLNTRVNRIERDVEKCSKSN